MEQRCWGRPAGWARRRRILRAWPLGVALLLSLSAMAASGSREPRQAPLAMARGVVVGDTLWALARECQAPRRDPRQLVWLLERLNDLPTVTLQPGQVLLLPIGERSVRAALRDPVGFWARARIVEGGPVGTAFRLGP